MYAIITDQSVGGTFLTWSLHYLSGHKEYYCVRENQWLDLTSTPLTDTNAHNFLPNQPTSIPQFNTVLSKLDSVRTDKFHTIYFHNFREDQADYKQIYQQVEQYAKKTIYLTLDNIHALYQCKYQGRVLTHKRNLNELHKNFDEQHEEFVHTFFNDSYKKWAELGLLNSVWDKREFIALNFRPFSNIKIEVPKFDTYTIEAVDLFTNFDLLIESLFEYLGLIIDQSRLEKWLIVYKQWKSLHYDRLRFMWYFEPIVDNILSGKAMSLERFNLDIVREGAIQHALIYRHNLNLKTWQLEKFIDTQQLHNLLEPNIHPLIKA